LEDGRKIFSEISLGNKESYRDWFGFFHSLRRRGSKAPSSVTSDGALGLLKVFRGNISSEFKDSMLET